MDAPARLLSFSGLGCGTCNGLFGCANSGPRSNTANHPRHTSVDNALYCPGLPPLAMLVSVLASKCEQPHSQNAKMPSHEKAKGNTHVRPPVPPASFESWRGKRKKSLAPTHPRAIRTRAAASRACPRVQPLYQLCSWGGPRPAAEKHAAQTTPATKPEETTTPKCKSLTRRARAETPPATKPELLNFPGFQQRARPKEKKGA
mgnify:CR=1 FL=1